jgi:phosphopantetheinyl transferase
MQTAFINKLENGSLLGLMETTISTFEMLESLNWEQSELKDFHELRSEKKKKEWLGVRLLLGEIFKRQPFNLEYDDQGKPFLSDPFYNISISHSGKYVCVLVDQHKKVGVDIQVFKPNIEKGIALFMSEKELQDCLGNMDSKRLHVYWGAKEAIYKFYGLKKTNIKTDIYISPFEINATGSLEGKLTNKNIISLNYQITDEYVLVCTF